MPCLLSLYFRNTYNFSGMMNMGMEDKSTGTAFGIFSLCLDFRLWPGLDSWEHFALWFGVSPRGAHGRNCDSAYWLVSLANVDGKWSFIFSHLHFSWFDSAVFCDLHITSSLSVCISSSVLSDGEPKFSLQFERWKRV